MAYREPVYRKLDFCRYKLYINSFMVNFDRLIFDSFKLLYYLRFLPNIDGGFVIEPDFMTTRQMIVK